MFERLLLWSLVSGALWLAGAALDPDQRLLLWIPALGLELAAPFARYWLPGRGRAATTDWDIDGGHFAERCQLFIIIALGESIVVTGATAADAGLTSTVVACLVVAFLETVALWWLYFGAPAERSHAMMSESDDPGRIARNAYTYVHVLIVAGIIATAAGVDLLIAHPHDPQHGVGLAIILGGPALFLLGESLFQWSATGTVNVKRLAAAAADRRACAARTRALDARAHRDRDRTLDGGRDLGAAGDDPGRSGLEACLCPSQPVEERLVRDKCTHTDQVRVTELPESVDGCEECLRIGGPWLHLRICLVCGKVGCCNDSLRERAAPSDPPIWVVHVSARAKLVFKGCVRGRASSGWTPDAPSHPPRPRPVVPLVAASARG